jgi:hypothetical protein
MAMMSRGGIPFVVTTALWLCVMIHAVSVSVSVSELEYRLTDESLEVVRIDSSPDESFLSMRADAMGRLFVGGREGVFVYEPVADGLGKRLEIYRFPAGFRYRLPKG